MFGGRANAASSCPPRPPARALVAGCVWAVRALASDYDNIITAVGTDPRISHSHTQVPGPDGRSGFGGACFPKDTNALSAFAGTDHLSILKLVIAENNNVRSQYELDDREKEQKVVYIS